MPRPQVARMRLSHLRHPQHLRHLRLHRGLHLWFHVNGHLVDQALRALRHRGLRHRIHPHRCRRLRPRFHVHSRLREDQALGTRMQHGRELRRELVDMLRELNMSSMIHYMF